MASNNWFCVPPARVAEIWPHVSGLIFVAIKKGDLSAFKPIEEAVLSGRNLLWIVWDGDKIVAAVVTEIQQSEWRKVCVIVACGGENMRDWIGYISELEKFAKAEGCTGVRIFGREGWRHMLPNYETKRIVLERKIT